MELDRQIPFGATLRPSEKEFANFRAYVNRLSRDPKYANAGAVKVVPPAGFRRESLSSPAEIAKLTVVSPIEQQVCNGNKLHQLVLHSKKSMSVPDYKRLVDADERLLPGLAKQSSASVERFFWANLHLASPLYGADVKNSLFRRPPSSAWNMNRLDSLLDDILGGQKLAGINEPYLYIGGFRTMFAWHVEDLNLASANYLHSGSPKFWYCIGRKDYKKFEQWVKTHYPQGFITCAEFLRHKTTVVDPYLLARELPELHIEKHVQHAGEMMVVFGSAYHSGFNFGFNVAEAVNFATDDWLAEFPKFKSCRCHPKNMRMDVAFVANALKDQKQYANSRDLKNLLAIAEKKQGRSRRRSQAESPGRKPRALKKKIAKRRGRM